MRRGFFYSLKTKINRRRRINKKLKAARSLLEKTTFSDWSKGEVLEMALATIISQLEDSISKSMFEKWKKDGMEIDVDEWIA